MTFRVPPSSLPICEKDPNVVSRIIYDKLMSDKPCMIARFGAFELSTLVNYLGVKRLDHSIIRFIQGKEQQWWWNNKLLSFLHTNAGFFPPTIEKIEQFCELMLDDIKDVDVLGSWLPEERYFENQLSNSQKVFILLLEPYLSKSPWSKCLKGKKVLVVHPFAELIEAQYKKRQFLFENSDVLPEFEIQTIKAVQSIGGQNEEFANWFDALQWMKNEIDARDFDICLIGAGAYGFALAAYVKRSGKKSVHLGGALQLLFGIKGKRWVDPNYNTTYNYLALMNEHWVYPEQSTKPMNADQVEGGCYW